jgi:hypothetical protein
MNIHDITHLLTDNKNDFKRFTNITALARSNIQLPTELANTPRNRPFRGERKT